jgi:hypothetical protein
VSVPLRLYFQFLFVSFSFVLEFVSAVQFHVEMRQKINKYEINDLALRGERGYSEQNRKTLLELKYLLILENKLNYLRTIL